LREKEIKLLCSLTGFSSEYVRKHINSLTYIRIKIPKKNGTLRVLNVPEDSLKRLQRIILERILYSLPVSPVAHCAVPGRSVKTHILPHLASKSFFRIDFKDAFPSVNKNMFTKRLAPLIEKWLWTIDEFEFGGFANSYVGNLLEILAQLTLYQDSLPQGAPCSPYLFNLVCYELDLKLSKFSSANCLIYTRYADDLWFSTEKPEIASDVRSSIVETIKAYGFGINRSKVKYKTGKAVAPKILGVTIVDQKTKIARKKIEEYRTKIHLAINNDSLISIEEIFGIINYVSYWNWDKKIPKRLKDPFLIFLEKRCPEKIPYFRAKDIV